MTRRALGFTRPWVPAKEAAEKEAVVPADGEAPGAAVSELEKAEADYMAMEVAFFEQMGLTAETATMG